MSSDKHLPSQPEWISRFIDGIHRRWQYHAPCSHVNVQASWDDEQKTWQVQAAPVFQEVLGGSDDGKKVWAGFSFEVGGIQPQRRRLGAGAGRGLILQRMHALPEVDD